MLVGGAITLAAFTVLVGASWQFRYALLAALATSLILTQFLAHGMTSPLRQMTAAARAMARGDYSRRVRATSRDEVGSWQRRSTRWPPTSGRPTSTGAG